MTRFDGTTFNPGRDAPRLAGQLERVKRLMLDGHWRRLRDIAIEVRGTETAVSARLRDLRKPRFGRFVVERRHVGGGLHEYRMLPPMPTGQQPLFSGGDTVALPR